MSTTETHVTPASTAALPLRERWQRFWFEPVGPGTLGFCRMVFFGFLFVFYLNWDFGDFATVPPSFYRKIHLFAWFHLPMLSERVVDVLQIIWKVALALACVGLFTRISMAVSFVLGVYILGLQHNFGKHNHSDAILVFAMGILAFTYAGDAWSLDRLIRRRRALRPTAAPTDADGRSPEYRWPIRMVWVLMAIIWFAAGYAKLKESGINWAFSDTLANNLMVHHYSHHPPTNWGLWLADHPWLCRFFALGSLMLEAGAPLALVSLWFRRAWVPGIAAMQLGIKLMLGVSFVQFMICYIFWLPWDRIGRELAAWFGREPPRATTLGLIDQPPAQSS